MERTFPYSNKPTQYMNKSKTTNASQFCWRRLVWKTKERKSRSMKIELRVSSRLRRTNLTSLTEPSKRPRSWRTSRTSTAKFSHNVEIVQMWHLPDAGGALRPFKSNMTPESIFPTITWPTSTKPDKYHQRSWHTNIIRTSAESRARWSILSSMTPLMPKHWVLWKTSIENTTFWIGSLRNLRKTTFWSGGIKWKSWRIRRTSRGCMIELDVTMCRWWPKGLTLAETLPCRTSENTTLSPNKMKPSKTIHQSRIQRRKSWLLWMLQLLHRAPSSRPWAK